MNRSRNRRLRHSRAQESATARSVGGRTTPASGALPMAGGDVRSDAYLVENKRTDKLSMSLKREWLDKVKVQAAQKGIDPLIGIEFGDGVNFGGDRWVLMPEYVADDLRRRAGDDDPDGG